MRETMNWLVKYVGIALGCGVLAWLGLSTMNMMS
jgi:hypothetical protein